MKKLYITIICIVSSVPAVSLAVQFTYARHNQKQNLNTMDARLPAYLTKERREKAQHFMSIGEKSLKERNFKSAEKHFKDALEENPLNGSELAIAHALEMQGKNIEAIKYYRLVHIVYCNPEYRISGSSTQLLHYAELAEKLGYTQEATDVYHRAIAGGGFDIEKSDDALYGSLTGYLPRNPSLKQLHAWALTSAGLEQHETEEERQIYFARALKLDDQIALAYLLRGKYLEHSDPKTAKIYLEKAIRLKGSKMKQKSN
jgi:tetratricopeptide (TPR) repeat protein